MIIDGKKIAEEMLAELAEEVKKITATASHLRAGVRPRLAAVLVENPHSKIEPLSGARKFLWLKKKAAEKVGLDFRIYEFPANITTQKLRKEIVNIVRAGVNHGVMIELPLPMHINTQYVLNAIPPEKDVDVLSEKSQGAFFTGRSAILPPAVETIEMILEKSNMVPRGKHCTIFGYGLLVGKPIGHWLAQQGATISIINEYTLDPKPYTLKADIIISGVGKPNIIKADMIKDGAVVVDFGYENFEGKSVGDVDFESVSQKASLITPVPGGVGPIVIATVFKNLLTLVNSR